MRLLSQKEIAERSGHSESSIHYILNGDRTPSRKMAEDLERATCICRTAWLWPEWSWNPYIPMSDTTYDGRLWVRPFECPYSNPCEPLDRWCKKRILSAVEGCDGYWEDEGGIAPPSS